MPIETLYEQMPAKVYESANEASVKVADRIADLIRENNRKNTSTVLGLATGSTPIGVYDELIRRHREEDLSFENAITFNLDEYYPIDPEAEQSYIRFMDESLFNHIDIKRENIHIPDGTLAREEVDGHCQWYENKIKESDGIDLQILGIGRTGHIGFNEPGSGKNSRTRMITLDKLTRRDAAADFSGKENVPRQAITMGIGTIMDAKKVLLMAWGEHKSEIVARAFEGEVTDQIPATFLQEHPNAEFILDEDAAAQLATD